MTRKLGALLFGVKDGLGRAECASKGRIGPTGGVELDRSAQPANVNTASRRLRQPSEIAPQSSCIGPQAAATARGTAAAAVKRSFCSVKKIKIHSINEAIEHATQLAAESRSRFPTPTANNNKKRSAAARWIGSRSGGHRREDAQCSTTWPPRTAP